MIYLLYLQLWNILIMLWQAPFVMHEHSMDDLENVHEL